MAIANTAHGGSATNTTAAATTLAITVAIAVGEFIWVTIATVANSSATAVSDNAAGGSNLYQFFSKKVGASSEISCWFCYSARATATTITATHAASRASGSASTYTGVLGVGQWKDATNAANNNTVTLTNALGAGNLTLAGMGDALGTQTWTAVTGTLRNNLAGGGSTTPGTTNIEGSTTTVAASLSVSVSGEAVAIELLSAALPEARDTNEIHSDIKPPFMWSMGSMPQVTIETEQFDWGWKPPQLATYQEDAEYQNIPQQILSWFDIETEQFDLGFNVIPGSTFSGYETDIVYFDQAQQLALNYMQQDTESDNQGTPIMTAAGANLMGFRGFRSLKAAMGSLDDWSFNPTAVVAAINAFDDVDQAVAQQALGFMADEVERDNWGWLPPMAQVVLDEAHLDHRFKFDGPTELEAITEDFIAEMVSVDELYTGQTNISPIYQEDELFGFQTATVTVNQPWDAELNPADVSWNARQDLDDFGQQPVFVQEDSLALLAPVVSMPSTDEDQVQAEFFATDRVPEDFEQLVMTNQLALYWTDQDTSQATFFAQEQYADQDEQFVSPYLTRYQEEDVFGFNTPELLGELVLDEEIPFPNPPYPVIQQTEDEQFGQNAPFLTVTSEVWELQQWPNLPYPLTHQVELDQFGQQAPFLTAQPFDDTDQMGQNWWARDVDDSWGFNTPEVEGELLLEEEVQMGNQPYLLWQQTEDEQFGKQAPFIPAMPYDDSPDQLGQTWWAREQTEEGQHGQQAPFLTAIGFDEDQFTASRPAVADEVEWLNFAPGFVDSDNQDRLPGQITVQDDEQFSFQTTNVFLPWDAELNPTQQRSYYFQSEDLEKYNWGWLPPMTKAAEDDSPYDARVQLQSYFVPAIEDEQFSWGFDRSRFYALGDEAPYLPLPQQLSLVPEMETEQFDWGFNQPVVTVQQSFDQDEPPAMTLQRVYQEDDFGQQVQFIALDPTMDGPQVLPLQLVDQIDDLSTGRPFVDADTVEIFAAGPVPMVDEEFGFNVPEVVGELVLDEELQAGNAAYPSTDDIESFGFQQQFVMALDDSPEQLPANVPVRDDAEQFGFQTQTSADQSFPDDNTLWQKGPTIDDVDQFNLDTAFAQTTEPDLPSPGVAVVGETDAGFTTFAGYLDGNEQAAGPNAEFVVRVDEEQFGFNQTLEFSFGDEIDQLPNLPYPASHQLELDQTGLQSPFIQAVSLDWDVEQGSKYWPGWRPDLEDYNVGLFQIKNIVPKIWNFAAMSTMEMAALALRPQLQVSAMTSENTIRVQAMTTRLQVMIASLQAWPRTGLAGFQVRA